MGCHEADYRRVYSITSHDIPMKFPDSWFCSCLWWLISIYYHDSYGFHNLPTPATRVATGQGAPGAVSCACHGHLGCWWCPEIQNKRRCWWTGNILFIEYLCVYTVYICIYIYIYARVCVCGMMFYVTLSLHTYVYILIPLCLSDPYIAIHNLLALFIFKHAVSSHGISRIFRQPHSRGNIWLWDKTLALGLNPKRMSFFF